MTTIKERPIPFSTPMVQAILDGRKTMTRRIVKDVEDYTDVVKILDPSNDMRPFWRFSLSDGEATGCEDVDCPYGVVDDRLWVKEGLTAVLPNAGDTELVAAYTADGELVLGEDGRPVPWRWKKPTLPYIFMPRWASRFTLENADVRIERLHDISEEDAIAEGLDVKTCERVFRKAAGRTRQEHGRWLEYEGGGEPSSNGYGYWCLDCVEKAARRHGADICGWNDDFESDGVPYCEDCGVQICHSLTKYGADQALYLTEEDELFRPHFPMSGNEALALAELASGMGELQDEHHGRLAQIAFATLWEQINGKDSWAANPWLWVITFRRIDA